MALKVKRDELSARQQKIIDYIRSFWLKRGYPPSIRDVVTGCALSSTSVADYNLKILEKRGYLQRHREVSRGIELTDRLSANKLWIPIIGTIAAGQPLPVPDNDTWDSTASSDTIEVTEDLVRGREGVYALRVKGSSMMDALISDGDIVLLQNVNAVENGEMVAVWLKSEMEVTLKKFYAEADIIRLQPANSQMEPLFFEPANVEIQGKVIAVIRRIS
ncbi:MAG: repressor LexA [Dehalococcoidia bacterium]|nr:MAG: repressor LexA [Dehalococcoidia bacterium]